MPGHSDTSTPQHLDTCGPQGRQGRPLKKLIATSLVLTVSLAALTHLSFQLAARLHYHWGGNAMEAMDYQEAARRYEKAAQGRPRDARVWNALGEALHLLSLEKPVLEAFPMETQAMEAFKEAARLMPIDAEAHYGLARSTARLEQMHFFVSPNVRENPFQPLPHFQRAVELRPNGILYRYALARYLYRIADIRAFRDNVRELVRVYPPTYSRLRREPFWSRSLEAVVQQGLLDAVETNVMPRHALMALADIMSRNNKHEEAAKHYALALQYGSPRENTPAQHIRLGRLYLQAGERHTAEEVFAQALAASNSRDADLRRVLAIYRAQNHIEGFLGFFDRADRSIPFSPEARLVVARALMEAKEYTEARFLLENLNKRRPTAQAYFLLYRIAREQRDAGRMETAIQQATVLDPRNSRYHQLLSQVLRDAGKLEMAERAATRAIEHNTGPADRLYHFRAGLRLRMKDNSGALDDWNRAISISPNNAAYHAGAAEALVQLARFDEALTHSARAAALDPETQRYRQRHSQLKDQLRDP